MVTRAGREMGEGRKREGAQSHVMGSNEAYTGDHSVVYASIKLSRGTPKLCIMLYTNFMSIQTKNINLG